MKSPVAEPTPRTQKPATERSSATNSLEALREKLAGALAEGRLEWNGEKPDFREPTVVNHTDELFSDTVVKNRQ